MTEINSLLSRSLVLYEKAITELEEVQKSFGLSDLAIRKLNSINRALLDTQRELREAATYSKLEGLSTEEILIVYKAALQKLGIK